MPPSAWQVSELRPWTQPWPLQAFWPLQALWEDLQALCPLQALTPKQSVEFLPNDGLCGVCALTTDATNVPAANALAAVGLTFADEKLSRLNRPRAQMPAVDGPAGRPYTRAFRARSSAGEHTLDMGGVTGSIPVAPTIRFFSIT